MQLIAQAGCHGEARCELNRIFTEDRWSPLGDGDNWVTSVQLVGRWVTAWLSVQCALVLLQTIKGGRLTGRLAKVQADIQAYNSVPEGQAEQVNVPALMKAREELVGALVGLKRAINEANREAQRDIYLLAEKKATAQFLAGVNTRHGPQPAVYPNTTEVIYVAALKKADVDALMVRLENAIDQLQDRLDQFNHVRKIEVDGRILELAS